MSRALSNLLGMVGALAGGALGVVIFGWVVSQGFYAPFLIGGLVGLGCLALARHPSWGRGIACAVVAVVLEVVAEWREFPFVADRSFGYFLAHLNDLRPLTMLLMTLGAVLAAWLGRDHWKTMSPPVPERPGSERIPAGPGGNP
jgi:hypothetical protein